MKLPRVRRVGRVLLLPHTTEPLCYSYFPLYVDCDSPDRLRAPECIVSMN